MSYTNGLDKPSDYFNTITWSGDSSSPKTFTVGFQPDLIWGKLRNTAYNHQLYDSVRGFGNNKDLQSSASTTEGGGTADLYGYISGTTSTGFTATKGSDATADGYGYWNESGRTYVAWNWLASNTTASNTDGSITSTVSTNTTSGFSICTFTTSGGSVDEIGHGLGVAPSMIILKSTTNVNSWSCYHKSLGNNQEILLNGTGASSTNTIWNNTTPTSTIFNLNLGNFGTSRGAVAYCFAEKKGFSKAFSYSGNGSSNGSYIHLGFLPTWVLVKRTDSANAWHLFDNKRNTFNPNDKGLFPNTADAENTGNQIDFLSNGIKFYSADGGYNGSGGSYIGLAFASNPFVTSTGIPTTAR